MNRINLGIVVLKYAWAIKEEKAYEDSKGIPY